MKARAIVAVLASVPALAPPARGGPLGDAIARHADADVEALRAHPEDAAARCALGVVYARRGDLPRAALRLEGCDQVSLEPDVADAVARASAEVGKALRHSTLSALSIVTTPSGALAETDALPGERFATPATVWARAGTYHVRVAANAAALAGAGASTTTITLAAHSRGTVVLELPAAPRGPRDGTVDFSEDNAGEVASGPPPDVKHGTLLPHRYIDGGTAGGVVIDDPLARAAVRAPAHPPALRIGLRAGAGAFGHAGGGRIGPSLAAALHLPIFSGAQTPRPLEAEVRLDASRRGGLDGGDGSVDVGGASIGVTKVVLAPQTAWLAAGLAIRGEVRSGDMLGTEPLARTGLGLAATVELALRRLPVVVGARYEQGLTELVPGTREHAILVEAGVDWRVF